MPAGQGSNSSSQRATFRPPWIKDGPDLSASPGNKFNMELRHTKQRGSTSSSDSSDGEKIIAKQLANLRTVEAKEDEERISITPEREPGPVLEQVQLRKVGDRKPYDRESFRKEKDKNNPIAGVKLKKTTVKTKEPQKNGDEKEVFFQKPQLKPVPVREKTPPKKDYKLHDLPNLKKVEERKLPEKPLKLAEDVDIDRELPAKRNSLVRGESMRRLSQQGPAPPPMPPPPPGMPGEGPQKPMTDSQRKRIENLKARPKVRPDWSQTLKEIESGKKLRHVECNDRSQPLLPEAKAQEHFVFDSETPNVHNELLKQIETGFKLKKVQTNDRSKPMLEGLRKFRRQMTIEEQIQKSMSMASIPPEEITPDEVDEMDDIDKVRDDLQSTKQMLALELRNKEAQEMENKRLMSRIANLEAELEKAKSSGGGKGGQSSAADDKIIKALKQESEQSRKSSEQVEKKYTEAMKELDTTKLKMEEYKRKTIELEKKLQDALSGKRVSFSERQNSQLNGENEDELEEEETEEESDGEDNPEKREKKLQKEVKQLVNKLRNFKVKEDNAKKERIALKEIIKKHHLAMKEEKKKYNKIKKEVDKMASLLKDTNEDEEDDEDKEDNEEDTEEEEVEEEESSEEESESESEESDSELSQSEPEDAPLDKKKVNLSARVKKHENRVNALKKGNFLFKTNAERLQDDLNKQKEMTDSLQHDLDSVLSELG